MVEIFIKISLCFIFLRYNINWEEISSLLLGSGNQNRCAHLEDFLSPPILLTTKFEFVITSSLGDSSSLLKRQKTISNVTCIVTELMHCILSTTFHVTVHLKIANVALEKIAYTVIDTRQNPTRFIVDTRHTQLWGSFPPWISLLFYLRQIFKPIFKPTSIPFSFFWYCITCHFKLNYSRPHCKKWGRPRNTKHNNAAFFLIKLHKR